jgi:hypothetical protein
LATGGDAPLVAKHSEEEDILRLKIDLSKGVEYKKN